MPFKFQARSPIASLPFQVKLSRVHSARMLQMKSSGHLKGITGSKTSPGLLITQIRAMLSLEMLEQINHLQGLMPCRLPVLCSAVRLSLLPLLLLAFGIIQLIL